MYDLLEALRIIAVLILPFMPDSAGKIMEQLGIEDQAQEDFQSIRRWGGLMVGQNIKQGGTLFPRVPTLAEESPVAEDGAAGKRLPPLSRLLITQNGKKLISGRP